MGRVGLDLLANAGDADVDRPVERFRIAGLGEVEETLAGQHPLRVLGEGFEEAELRGGERVLVLLLIAERPRVQVEPLRAHANGAIGRALCLGGSRGAPT
jgi:hypothetical protein